MEGNSEVRTPVEQRGLYAANLMTTREAMAKDFLAALLSDSNRLGNFTTSDQMSDLAIKYADSLLRRLGAPIR